MQPAASPSKLAWRCRQVARIFLNDERRVCRLPALPQGAFAREVAEQWCEDCGALTPREMAVA